MKTPLKSTEVTQRLQPAALTRVKIADGFWSPRLDVNRTVTLPHQDRMCQETGRIDAFRLTWKPGMDNPPHIFWDSDVGKWLEAVAYSLATHPDAELEQRADDVIELIAGAQQPDGYLNTHFTVVEPEKRWINLDNWHELYCAGHLMEGAVAYAEATGKRRFLDVMCRYADHIDATFGREPGKKRGYCGHPEVELALVRLYRATGVERYLKLAEYFVDERGRQPYYFDVEALARGEERKDSTKRYEYCQSHKPLREQSEIVGHAVRAFYIYCGMADVAALTGDAGLLAACRRLWDDATLHKLYITGGVGPSARNEGFTQAYDLPNETAYAETCATIALAFFAHRLLQIDADGRYADVIERALYNGILSGVSLDGKGYFYANPLASMGPPPGTKAGGTAGGGHTSSRVEWFGCACCPPNLARLLASLGQYVYSTSARAAYVHLYAGGEATLDVAGTTVHLTQKTDYPWDGEVRFVVAPAQTARFDLMLRIPGWCGRHSIRVNGRAVKAPVSKGYARLSRVWQAGDAVTLTLAMPVERVAAHPRVLADVGKVALQRGPVVYCLEECDNPHVNALVLPPRSKLTARRDARLLGGVAVIEGTALRLEEQGWNGRLYAPAGHQKTRSVRFRAIPYFAWANRKPGAMTVWLPQGPV
jgi:DUF1680 family protein